MKILSIIIILLFSCDGLAFRCPKKTYSNHLVITFEGLGGETYGAPVYNLASEVNLTNFQIARFANNSTPATISACIRRWLTNTPFGKVSILGQGIGGGTAYRVARTMGTQGMNVENLILFDSREGDEKTCDSDSAKKYFKPRNVKYVFNYYQCGRLPGRQFVETKGVYNYELDSSHILLPKTEAAKSFAKKLLNHAVIAHKPRSMVDFTEYFMFGPTLSEIGELSQREALYLVKPVHNVIREPASTNGEPLGQCFSMGVSYECTYEQSIQQKSVNNSNANF